MLSVGYPDHLPHSSEAWRSIHILPVAVGKKPIT